MLQGVLCQFQLVLQILENQSNADFKEQQLDFSSAAFVAPWVFLLIGKRFLKTPLLRVFPAHGLAEQKYVSGDENTESPKAGFYSCESVSNVQTGAEKF